MFCNYSANDPDASLQGYILKKLYYEHGDVFFCDALHIAQSSGRFKMVYIDGAIDSKAWGAIHHFETTHYRALL